MELPELYAMRYSTEGVAALIEAVEAAGGANLTDHCLPQRIEYVEPQTDPEPLNGVYTQGCGHELKMVFPYEPDADKRQGGSGFATCCAVCDGLGAMPRFEKAVRAVDPRYWDALEWADEEDDDAIAA